MAGSNRSCFAFLFIMISSKNSFNDGADAVCVWCAVNMQVIGLAEEMVKVEKGATPGSKAAAAHHTPLEGSTPTAANTTGDNLSDLRIASLAVPGVLGAPDSKLTKCHAD